MANDSSQIKFPILDLKKKTPGQDSYKLKNSTSTYLTPFHCKEVLHFHLAPFLCLNFTSVHAPTRFKDRKLHCISVHALIQPLATQVSQYLEAKYCKQQPWFDFIKKILLSV
jgi:hypothetical protein